MRVEYKPRITDEMNELIHHAAREKREIVRFVLTKVEWHGFCCATWTPITTKEAKYWGVKVVVE